MNITQLRDALDGELARKDVVLVQVAHKRARRRRVQIVIAASVAAVAAAVVGITVATNGPGQSSPTPSVPPVGSGCGPLRQLLATAASRGQSIIEGYGHLTGRSVTEDRSPYHQMRVTDVRTVSGPLVPTTVLGWIRTTPYPAATGDIPGLWAPDGHLVAIVTPAHVANTTLGPLLSTAPVVGDNVVLSMAGCWTDTSLNTTPFTGPLQEVPGSNAYNLAKQFGGLHAYPLADLIRLIAR
jgi:hypothetical protein